MTHYTRFSAHASLAAAGLYMRQKGLWQTVEDHVHIKQKVRHYQPLDKLKVSFVNILAGGHGLVEVNTRVRPDEGLQRSFGLEGCPEQSVVSTTVNACGETNVCQLGQALKEIYRQHSRSYQHDYKERKQLLDVDMTGMPAGRKAEGATKGYFSGKRNRRGRQLGRVLATRYDEIVVERLYPGKRRLERSLQELVRAAEEVMKLDQERRNRTIIRVDGGGGRDEDVNWILERGYGVLVKVKNWKRAYKLARSVTVWHDDPKIDDREFGWVEEPHHYGQPTRQLAVRAPKKGGGWHYWVLVFNLSDKELFELGRQPLRRSPTLVQIATAALYAYDLRSGGVETANKGSKLGLGLTKRNKKKFTAQEILVLLAQLAYNLITWIRLLFVQHAPQLRRFGPLRIVRDVFHVPGRVDLDDQGRILQIVLNEAHLHASLVKRALSPYLARDGTSLILDKT